VNPKIPHCFFRSAYSTCRVVNAVNPAPVQSLLLCAHLFIFTPAHSQLPLFTPSRISGASGSPAHSIVVERGCVVLHVVVWGVVLVVSCVWWRSCCAFVCVTCFSSYTPHSQLPLFTPSRISGAHRWHRHQRRQRLSAPIHTRAFTADPIRTCSYSQLLRFTAAHSHLLLCTLAPIKTPLRQIAGT